MDICRRMLVASVFSVVLLMSSAPSGAKVKAWEGILTIPTYGWTDDVNPKFWALEDRIKLSTTVKGAIVYPYTMQDHLSRTKEDRIYKALFLENEYLKVTCLPELGGRLHSVLDKSTGQETFHANQVIKPSMIAMRGAFISGGVEWNAGPQVHTVTIVSPVDALVGTNADGSVYLEVSNLEQTLRTRWTVRVTLCPGRSYLDEQIRIFNPTDAINPYYFWNCTAFPCRKGTRFIYPMTLGTDHNGVRFFSWPVHEGRDLSWLKNYPAPSSIFAVDCTFDFFGAYDVDADRGVIQVADHYELIGKKAWTWGTSEFGLVCQENLTDDDGPYIEVQSGPLPTQSDYGRLLPRQEVAWREWWYPVHGFGDGFEYATKDLAVQTVRKDGELQLRMLATGRFPGASCIVSRASNPRYEGVPRVEGVPPSNRGQDARDTGTPSTRRGQNGHDTGRELLAKRLDLSPKVPQIVTIPVSAATPVDVAIRTRGGEVLASFTTPLPIPETPEPRRPQFTDKSDEQLTIEEMYLKAQKYDLGTNRKRAREYYEKTLAADAGYAPALRDLAVLDMEAALYSEAIERLEKAVERNPNDGLAWYFLGVSHLKSGNPAEALHCARQAARCPGTGSLAFDLAGRGHMALKEHRAALDAFRKATQLNPRDTKARDHLLLAMYAAGDRRSAFKHAETAAARHPTDLVPRGLLALQNDRTMARFVKEVRSFVGEDDFEMLETGLAFAELGLASEAARLVAAVCVDAVAEKDRNPLPMYYLAWFASLAKEAESAKTWLNRAAATYKDCAFASRPEELVILGYALRENPTDAHAHLHIGNLYAHLGRPAEAVEHWRRAADSNPSLSVAHRNLGLYAWAAEDDLPKAERFYRRAIEARPKDQTLYRDLAEILIAQQRRPDAIKLLESVPSEGLRRADIIIMLAQAFFDEQRYGDAIDLLESTPYFVNWEGQTITWELFHRAHMKRGQNRFESKDWAGALQDFEAALTYPKNIGVGRSNRPQEAAAQYWKGKSLEALGRVEQARSAWKEGAAGREGSDEQNRHRRLCSAALQEME